MPLLIILFGLIAPRTVLVLAACFGVFSGVWSTLLWPILGFLFMPYTTIAYGLAHRYGTGVEGVWLIVMIIAVVLDLGANGGSANEAKRSRRRQD